MTSAAQVMDEINDFLDVLDTKLSRLSKNMDRLETGTKNTAEIKKLRETCEKEADRIANDIKTLNYDLKRLPKDREAEFSDKVASVKSRLNKLEKRLKKGDTVNQDEIELQVSVRDDDSKIGPNKQAKKKKKKRLDTSAIDVNAISPNTNAALIQEEEEKYSPEFVKIDIRTAPKEDVGNKALEIQEKSKQAVSRIVNRLGQAEDLAKEELIEL